MRQLTVGTDLTTALYVISCFGKVKLFPGPVRPSEISTSVTESDKIMIPYKGESGTGIRPVLCIIIELAPEVI